MATLSNIVFAHDVWFERHADGRVLSSRGSWPWDRYLAFSESVTVTCRMRSAGAHHETLEDVRRQGVEFVAVPSLSGPLATLVHRRAATAILRERLSAADALVARLPSEIGQLAVRVARKLGKPYAIEVVTCTWDALWHRGGLQGKLYAPVSRLNMRRAVRDAPYVLYVTREFLQRRYPTRGHAVACSDVELEPLDGAVLERRLETVDSGRTPFVIGTIAVLTVRFKGIQTALEALGAVRGSLPPFELRVVGAGDPTPWRELAARHGVEDRVSFVGVLPADEIDAWLDRVDLYVQPSFQEGLPRGLVEAMSRGCPALGSTAGGIPELLDPGCLHAPGDARRLGELIARAASDPAWREGQARRNFDAARAYTAPVLDTVRSRFWAQFADFAGRG
ncbi:MAG TPA: glycosyltransferase [Gaiellaceae bacterium]|nr:glycosyltransferase [Gaiellaceae bacterium]